MISFLSLISFLLRLTLVFQSQIVAVLPAETQSEKICIDYSEKDQRVHSTFNLAKEHSDALVESEKEEKNESEWESLADWLNPVKLAGPNLASQEYYNPFFGNKALQGNLHLYDLFQSWKTPLS